MDEEFSNLALLKFKIAVGIKRDDLLVDYLSDWKG